MRTKEQIAAEIEEKLGFVPPFFGPAQQSSHVLENLWQQTLAAYINNPLSPLFKEKLSAYLSRYCAVPYCMICHSCSLRPLGMEAREVLELLESPPPTETDIDYHLSVLALTPGTLTILPDSFSALEESLLYCSIFIAIQGDQAEYCRQELRRILEPSTYANLVTFIAYVKMCHVWMEAHPEVAYEADKRVQTHLGALLEDEPGLADFFRNYSDRVRRERQSRAERLAQITERQRHQEALRQSEKKYRSVVNNLKEGIFQTDATGLWTFLNPAWVEITGFSVAESIGTNFWNYIHPDDRQRSLELFQTLIERQIKFYQYEVRYLTKDGGFRWIEVSAQLNLETDETIVGTFGILYDITERQRAEEVLLQAKVVEAAKLELEKEIMERQRVEEQLRHNAFHDALTGLPNRTLFLDRLGHAVARAKRRQDYSFAVLFLDLDRFKVINDSLGHVIGDQLLIAIARRLEECLRPGDTVARLGGDEFTVLLDGVENISDATRVADRIQKATSLPFNLSGHEVFTTASVGIASSTLSYDQPEDLLRDADVAMYRAKALGKARYQVFDRAMHTKAMALLQLETDLRRALNRLEFRLHYQPIVDLTSGRTTGFEALLRWQHPDRGLVYPAEFIPVAEETGLIVPIGWWVLGEACRFMRALQVQFPENSLLTISVNLSVKQFLQPDMVEQIRQVLQSTGLDACNLALEITESELMANAEGATIMLCQLQRLGVKLFLDDFGTGYSSLSYLYRFPIDTLKIDRSFVKRMGKGGENSEIVQTIVTLAHSMGMNVTAEGVETAAQLAQLSALKCDFGQGYLFSKPVDGKGNGSDVLIWLQNCAVIR